MRYKKEKEYKYEYRGHEYFVSYTGISHIDKESHRMCKSHIDKIIKAKEMPNHLTKSYAECLGDFFKLIDIK